MENPEVPGPAGPRPTFGTEPPPKPRFAWGTFFIGVAAGVVGTVMLFVGAVVLLAVIGMRMAANLEDGDVALSAPTFPDKPTLSIYGEAEPTWTLHTLSGEPVKLGDYRGRVVFVNFWATWCGPCVMEMPSIQRLQEKMKDTDVVFLLVSDEDADTIEKFIKKKDWTLQSLHSDGKPPTIFHTTGIPATFIVNPGGMVVYRHIGSARWDADDVVRFLKETLVRRKQDMEDMVSPDRKGHGDESSFGKKHGGGNLL